MHMSADNAEVNREKLREKMREREKVREEVNVTKISEKILRIVPNLRLKDILAISPDLIMEWFGVNGCR